MSMPDSTYQLGPELRVFRVWLLDLATQSNERTSGTWNPELLFDQENDSLAHLSILESEFCRQRLVIRVVICRSQAYRLPTALRCQKELGQCVQ